MLLSLSGIKGYQLNAQDGKIGRIDDFYFDDRKWKIKYLIVETGGWLPGRKILISSADLYGKPDWLSKTVPVIYASKEAIP
jgi:uncharacterized protein YrrD